MRNPVYRSKPNSQRGFTLLELLTTTMIISILAAIAVISLTGYRARSYDQVAQVALRIVAIAEEAYFVDYSTYVSCDETTCPLVLPGIPAISAGVDMDFTSTGDECTGTSSHIQGSGNIYSWSS